LFEVFAKFEPSADIAVDWVDVESGSNLDQNLDHADPDPIQIDPDVGGNIPNRLLSTLRRNPLISRKLLAVELNVSERKIRDSLKILKDSGVIVRQGSDHGGIWRISHIVTKTKRRDTINIPQNEAVNEPVNGSGDTINGTINKRHEVVNGANEVVNEVVNGHREVVNEAVNEVVKTVFEAIKTKPGIKKPELQKITGKSHATIERAVDLLKKLSEIEYRGSDKTGGYYAVK
jgi:predicted HTH transcriptional regulator